MPPVKNVQQAINIGDVFISRYHFYKTLLTCNRAEKDWVLVYNVGVLVEEYVKIRIDPDTGEVLEYTNHGTKKP